MWRLICHGKDLLIIALTEIIEQSYYATQTGWLLCGVFANKENKLCVAVGSPGEIPQMTETYCLRINALWFLPLFSTSIPHLSYGRIPVDLGSPIMECLGSRYDVQYLAAF